MSPLLDLALLFVLIAVNGAPIVAAFLLGPRLGQPLDGDRLFIDGQPLIGRSKTWRGLVAALLAGTLVAPLVGLGSLTGLLLAALAMLGDLCSSFIKRRLRLAPSSRAPLLDQLPESVLPLWGLQAVLGIGWIDIVLVASAFTIIDMTLSRLLYRWHLRDRPY
ncbi:MAG: CDP-archaeol synthase [Pseudomonadota bacterium]